jgi:hypothetical protein
VRSRFFVLGLLFTLLAPALGGLGWLHFQKKTLKKELKQQLLAGLPGHLLVELAFSQPDAKSQLRWEHAQEFEFQGRMYDVVRAEMRGDSLVYHCFEDHAETALNRQIRTLIAKSLHTDPGSQREKEQWSRFFRTLYFDETEPWPFLAFRLFPQTPLPLRCLLFDSACSSPPAPPPERV